MINKIFAIIIPTANAYTGKAGQYSADTNYFYVCYADNLWSRILKTSW